MAEDEASHGWEANRRRKLVLGLEATPEQRLDWLEEMIALAHASGALPRRRDYVIPLEGTIEYGGESGCVALAKASFVSTTEGQLSFVASWREGEEHWSMRLKGFANERFIGTMAAPRELGDYRMHVSGTRTRITPSGWEIRGTYLDEGGGPGKVLLVLVETREWKR